MIKKNVQCVKQYQKLKKYRQAQLLMRQNSDCKLKACSFSSFHGKY